MGLLVEPGMRHATLPMTEVGIIAATRGMAGAGAGLLLADRVPEKRRKVIGWGLFAIGALTTVPLIIDVVRKSSEPGSGVEKVDVVPTSEPKPSGRSRRTGKRSAQSAAAR